MITKSLEGKVAIITGAGRGIGKAIALAYANAGASIVCAARTQSEIENTTTIIREGGGKSLAVSTDVTNLDSVKNLFKKTIEYFQGLDILVINAGANYDRCSIEKSNPTDWVKTIEVNLIGAYYCAQVSIPYLINRGAGKIITIGSGLGHRGRVERSAYSCSKAGLWMLTRVLAQELWKYRISINELIPGPVKTKLNTDQQILNEMTVEGESEWYKSPEDVTHLALFIATQPDYGPTAQSYSLMRRDN